MGDFITSAITAGAIAKVLVDAARLTNKIDNGMLPILAIAFGIVMAFVLSVASTGTLTIQSSATSVIVGIFAGGSAVGITSLQNFAQKEAP